MGQLTQVLRGMKQSDDPRLLVGPQTVDDAGVVVLGQNEGLPAGVEIALVQTVDYFPPVLDDAYLYGAVAAANSLSDVYAMGGKPVSALNIAGFPKGFDEEWVREIFQGGFDKIAEAGAVLAGGHTVESPEPQFGFAVTGVVQRAQLTANAGAKVGDVCYLTKPLGMGSMTTAGKFKKVSDEVMREAALQMATLNDRAAAAMNASGAHACTDITGFGLNGHARNIALASGVTIRLELGKLPIFPGARDLAAKGIVSGGTGRGKAALSDVIGIGPGLDQALVDIAYDAETSGGLLIVLPPERATRLEDELSRRDVPVHRVGEVVAKESDHLIELF
ncbi:Selenide, water dikinase [Planctomycetes bacterium Poly30]|uniref:Selenide, water dikinase n=2 Tax=Saltatorellus ferox TaxID=2528018 RepID=A0A518EVM0_9BACT|nr:Selenide, water dikinase [Planctomycetes bacterium Poly30]